LHEIRFRLKRGTAIETLPDGVLLFCQDNQQLHHLNDSSAVIAARLQSGATIPELVDEMSMRGVDRSDALGWAAKFLREAARLSLLEAMQLPLESFEAAQHLRISGIEVCIEYAGRDLFDLIGPAFAHLVQGSPHAGHAYQLSSAGEFVFIAKDSNEPAVVQCSMAAVRLKGLILEDILRSNAHLVALHAACMATSHGGSLLLGPPGSGKTTLALALMQRGYRYGSDDVTLVTADGMVAGVPLGFGIKETGWEIAGRLGIDVSELPSHTRPDGQSVRFLGVKRQDVADACPVRTIVRLQRGQEREAALKPLAPSSMLAELVRESRSPDGLCSAAIIHALAEIVGNAGCFDLRYSDARDAAALLCDTEQDAKARTGH
jgi:hypothetical protein